MDRFDMQAANEFFETRDAISNLRSSYREATPQILMDPFVGAEPCYDSETQAMITAFIQCHPEAGAAMIRPSDEGMCDICEEREWTHISDGYDSAPTDRGEERRYYEVRVCDACDPR